MSLIEECEKLRELDQGMYPGHIDVIEGNGLREYLKVNDKFGDHHIATVECHVWTGQIGEERWPAFENAKGLAAFRNLAPAMLEVLGCFRKGDAEILSTLLDYLESNIGTGDPEYDLIEAKCIKRLQAAAAMMEQEMEG